MLDLPQADTLLLFLAAVSLDALLGGRRWLGRLTGPDSLFFALNKRLIARLDRSERSNIERAVRGLLVCIIFLPLMAFLGSLVDQIGEKGSIGFILTGVLLALILGQRLVFEMVEGLTQMLADPLHEGDKNRFGAARWGAERQILRLSDGLVANSLFFSFGGFALLIPYRFLSMMVAAGSPSGLAGPDTPYFALPRRLYLLLAMVPSLLTCLLLIVSAPLIPGGQFKAFQGLRAMTKKGFITRSVPMAVTAHALGLAFRIVPDQPGSDNWVGPEEGKARLGAKDLKRITILSLVAAFLSVLLIVASISFILL